MDIKINLKLSQSEVFSLLNYFDDSSDTPLHEGLDFETYSKKLSDFAYFLIADTQNVKNGFIAFYKNEEGRFVYIPQIVVHKNCRHKGLGHKMMSALVDNVQTSYHSIQLEVLKENKYARDYYAREGFFIVEDRMEKFLLEKKL